MNPPASFHPTILSLAAALTTFLIPGVPLSAGPFQKDATKLDQKIRSQTDRFIAFQRSPESRIPAQVLAGARGIILIHKVKAGLGIGGEAGGGVALVRDRATGAWSAPGFVASAEGSWGLQIGAQETDIVFVLMNEAGLKVLQDGSINVGVDIRATAGPNAAGGDIDTTTIKEPVLVYSSSAGAFAGAAFKGGGILSAKKNNATYYGMTLDEILFQRKAQPTRSGQELIAVLNVASGMKAEAAAAAASGQPLPAQPPASSTNLVPPAPAPSPPTPQPTPPNSGSPVIPPPAIPAPPAP